MDGHKTKNCFEETRPYERSALVAAGSTLAPPDIHQPNSTLEHSRGQVLKKVVPVDQECSILFFLKSGLACHVEDNNAASVLMDKVTKFQSQQELLRCAITYKKILNIEGSFFEDHKHFELQRSCGKGVSGKVDAYKDMKTKMPFVRKRIENMAGFRREEVDSLLNLTHQNVCDIYAVLFHDYTVDLLLQDGGYPLKSCLGMFLKKNIPPERYWQVTEDLGQQGFCALEYIHREKICHLDVKPENLLVKQNTQGNPVLMVTDFGTSLTTGKEITFKMQMTPEYWPPEMWQHLMSSLEAFAQSSSVEQTFPADPAFDTFAMGLVVYFMATLQHLLIAEQKKQDTAQSVVPPAAINDFYDWYYGRFGHQLKYDQNSVFRMLLMTRHKHQLHERAMEGSWLFGGISPALREVIKGTLNPDTRGRWTDEQAQCFLSGKPFNSNREDQAPMEISNLKSPTPVADTVELKEAEETQHVSASTTHGLFGQDATTHGLFGQDATTPVASSSFAFERKLAPYLKVWDNDVRRPTASIPASAINLPAMAEDIAVMPGASAATKMDISGCIDSEQTLRLHLDGLIDHSKWQESVIEDYSQSPSESDLVVDLDMKVQMKSQHDLLNPTEETHEGFLKPLPLTTPHQKNVGHKNCPKFVGKVGRFGGKPCKRLMNSVRQKGNNPEKQRSPGKCLPQGTFVTDQCIRKMSFVVASSSNPTLRTHTLHGHTMASSTDRAKETVGGAWNGQQPSAVMELCSVEKPAMISPWALEPSSVHDPVKFQPPDCCRFKALEADVPDQLSEQQLNERYTGAWADHGELSQESLLLDSEQQLNERYTGAWADHGELSQESLLLDSEQPTEPAGQDPRAPSDLIQVQNFVSAQAGSFDQPEGYGLAHLNPVHPMKQDLVGTGDVDGNIPNFDLLL